MRLRMRDLLWWAVPTGALLGGLGAFPTWTWSGNPGLYAEAVAAVLAGMGALAAGWIELRGAREGPARVAAAFLPGEAYRLALVLMGAAVAWAILPLSTIALVLWVLLFHLAMLFCIVVWLVKALQRDARLVEQGKIVRLFTYGLAGPRKEITWDDV